jgi:molecular chaperone HscB
VIHVPAPDPFAVFGLPRALALDGAALERRYRALSRECHPDHNQSEETGDCAAVLMRAAEINDAFRVLRDPWLRARALLEALQPGVLERHKRLDPAFLADVLELAEQVAHAAAAAVPRLRDRLRALLAADFDAVRDAVAAGELAAAAARFHQAHYHKKALRDLEARS